MHLFGDLLIFAVLLNGLFLLVHSTRKVPAVAEWKWSILLLGLVWLGWAIFRDVFSTHVLGLPPRDAVGHERIGRQVAETLRAGGDVSAYFRLGNPAYQLWLGFLFAATDCSRIGVDLINGFLGFWASVLLLTICAHQVPRARIPWWLLLLVVLLPSAFYWTPTNLKEGPMYWGIVQSLSMVLLYRRITIVGSLGVIVMILMRPHVALLWVVSLAGALLLSRRYRIFAILAIVGSVALIPAVGDFVGRDLRTFDDVHEEIQMRGEAVARGGSATQDEIRIPFVSGFMMLMLRPFPWEMHSFAAALAGIEVYILTLLLVAFWLPSRKLPALLRHPAILVALVALVLSALMFSYWGNLGLVARQRLQATPAILMLLCIPALLARASRAGPSQAPPPHVYPAGFDATRSINRSH